MLKGIDIEEVVEFVAEADQSEPKTIFILGNISNRNKLKMFTGAISPDGKIDVSKLEDKAIDILLSGLKGIKQLGGVDYDIITEKVIDKLPIIVLSEVVSKILEMNFMSEQETKN